MEDNREPARPAHPSGMGAGAAMPPVPPATPPEWTAPGVAYTGPTLPPDAAPYSAPPPQPGLFSIALRMVRLILLRIRSGFIRVGRALRPYAGWLAALGVLVGVIAVQALLLIVPRIFPSNTTDNRVELIAPPQAVVSFLEGQSTYNGDLMWDAFSPELQATLVERGNSKELFVARAEDERLAGRRYRTISYIGGIQLGERSRYYYVVGVDAPQPDQAGSFSFIFTVNRDGKIVGVQRE